MAGCFSACTGCLGLGQDPAVFDFVIVGGGFSGAYAAYKLKKLNRRVKVCILEASNRLGGRLLSDDSQEIRPKKDELGGMRVFPKLHKEVAKLVEMSGCSLVKVGHSDETNLFYSGGKAIKKKDVILDPAKGRSPHEVVNFITSAFKKEFGEADPLEVEAIRGMNLRELFLKYDASEREFEEYIKYSGYDLFSDDDVCGALFLRECQLFDPALDDEQYYVHEGYELVVEMLSIRARATVKYRCKALGSEVVDGLRKVYTSRGEVMAKNVIYALPLPALKALISEHPTSVPEGRARLMDSVKTIPLFKAFIEWPREENSEQWWESMNLSEGNSTTDQLARQVHYYDNEDILIYNSGSYADQLNEKFKEDRLAATREVVDFLKEMHNNQDIPDPDGDKTIYKYWPDGSHKWKVGVDVYAAMETILYGSQSEVDDEGVYICGDAFSLHQGWVMGCVQTVEACIEVMDKRGRIGP